MRTADHRASSRLGRAAPVVTVLRNTVVVFVLAIVILTTVEVILDHPLTGHTGSRTTLGILLHGPG